jgi:hypothetical protein
VTVTAGCDGLTKGFIFKQWKMVESFELMCVCVVRAINCVKASVVCSAGDKLC